MKYLFIILVYYAVKGENVGNNYFIFEMEEQNLQQDIKDFKKPFKVYWNVPTMQCASKKIPFKNLYEKFGIIQNDNDRFIGNKIAIIYNEVEFPAIKFNKTSGNEILRNGGVPQEGNLEKHLIEFEKELNNKIPDPYFDGIGIIDFESWRPVFVQNFGSLLLYKNFSIKLEKQRHDWWPKMWIEKEASLRFEAAARRFMESTLALVKKMRPNALWGYYGLPHCFNMRDKNMVENCAKNTDLENDSIYWLWAESTALFPSLYSSVSLSSSQLSSHIKGRVKEASRVRGIDTPIFPYIWFRYRDAGFITEKDLAVALTTLYQSDASGFILWGSSHDVDTIEKCNKLYKYVETILGPNIAKYTKPIKRINTSTVDDNVNQSIPIRNTMKISSTENIYDKYSNHDDNLVTFSTGEMSSTESYITYNEYTNTDDLQTTKEDLFLSSSYETKTDYTVYNNIEQSPKNLENDELTSTKKTIIYINNTEESLQISNNDILNEKTTTEYNNHYVINKNVQSPNNEHNFQQDIKDFKKPFKVYWNVPTMQCASKKIPFKNLYEKFGIIQNDNDRFIGDKIAIIYNEVEFPAIKFNKTSGNEILRNGGVPQEGNLEKHLIEFEKELNNKIPDPYFDGIGIIDFESWRPVFVQNFGSLLLYKNFSIKLEKQRHDWWPKMWIEKEASLRFEAAARRFMESTLTLVKKMRPNALWGYYGLPHCFNMRDKSMAENCAKNTDLENDSIYWLWAESTALFPSLYSSVSLSSSQLSSHIKGRVKEASRVRGIDTPIFPYLWFRYRDAGFITEKDLAMALTTLYQSDASGFILWGSSHDVDTIEKCNKLYKYVETILGPNIAKYTNPLRRINTSTVDDNVNQSILIRNITKIPTTEISNIYDKHSNYDDNLVTFSNGEISPTESYITYNEYTNTDDLQTTKEDLFLSSSSSYETSTDYTVYNNIEQSSKSLENDELTSTKKTIIYSNNTNESLQTSNNDILNEETTTEYNNHYVINKNVQSPNNEHNFQQDIKDFKKPFQVYWNVPTMQCASKKIPFKNLYEKFGIIQNDNDRFIGNKIAIIYNEVEFPAIKFNKTSGNEILRNGGVPQEGNLEKHLIEFEKELNNKIPDPYFDGIGIIDFESWRPVFVQNFGSLLLYKNFSIKLEKQRHDWWPKMWIEKEASLRFEAAARRFMESTLALVKKMRPNALWGYYGLPHCFNMRNKNMVENCAKNTDLENDSIYWLWAESTAIFPSLYSSVSLSSSQLSSHIKGRVKEASRVRGIDTPIFPYMWFRYRDAGFITEKDLAVALTTLYQSDASGFILWGSSHDVDTIEKCNKLYKYMETILGPNIAKYTKPLKGINTSTVDDNMNQSIPIGNTMKISSTETLNIYDKHSNYDDNLVTLSNDEISPKESYIPYNEYTNTDDLQITKENVVLSLLKTSTMYSPYIKELSTTEPSTVYNKYTNADESTIAYSEYSDDSQISNNGDSYLSLSESSSNYDGYIKNNQGTQIPNFSEMSTIVNNKYTNADESTIAYSEYSDDSQISNNGDLHLSLSEFSSNYDGYIKNNQGTQIPNFSEMSTIVNNKYTNANESTIAYSEYSDDSQISNNGDLHLSLSESSSNYDGYIKNNQGTQIPNFSEMSTIVNNKYTNANESTIAYSEYSDDSQISNNGDLHLSLSESSSNYDGYIKNNQGTQIPNFSEMSTIVNNKYTNADESTIAYSEYSDDSQISNNGDLHLSLSESSSNYDGYIKNNQGTQIPNFSEMSTIVNNKYTNADESTIAYSEYSDDSQISNNGDLHLSLSESSSNYDGYMKNNQGTQIPNFSEMSTIVNNKYTNADESTIAYSEYSDDSQISNNGDLHLSLSESSSNYDEYIKNNQGTQIPNFSEMSTIVNNKYTNADESTIAYSEYSDDSQISNNGDLNLSLSESSSNYDGYMKNNQGTRIPNFSEMSTIVNNKYTNDGGNSQTLSYDELSSTQSTIVCSEHTDDSQILNTEDLSLSLLETSTFYDDYKNNSESTQTSDIDEMSATETSVAYNKYTNINEGTQALNNEDILSSLYETSTVYSEYNNIGQRLQRLNNDKMTLTKLLFYNSNRDESVQISDNDISNKETTLEYKNNHDINKKVQSLNDDTFI